MKTYHHGICRSLLITMLLTGFLPHTIFSQHIFPEEALKQTGLYQMLLQLKQHSERMSDNAPGKSLHETVHSTLTHLHEAFEESVDTDLQPLLFTLCSNFDYVSPLTVTSLRSFRSSLETFDHYLASIQTKQPSQSLQRFINTLRNDLLVDHYAVYFLDAHAQLKKQPSFFRRYQKELFTGLCCFGFGVGVSFLLHKEEGHSQKDSFPAKVDNQVSDDLEDDNQKETMKLDDTESAIHIEEIQPHESPSPLPSPCKISLPKFAKQPTYGQRLRCKAAEYFDDLARRDPLDIPNEYRIIRSEGDLPTKEEIERFHNAIKENSPERVIRLLKYDRALFELEDENGISPLQQAYNANAQEAMRMLFEAKKAFEKKD